MDFNQFNTVCKQIFSANPSLPDLDDDKIKKLYLLTERMLEVNKHMNLTAIKEERAIILKHYADSLTISKYIPKGAKIIDVGCGAGFPTLPLAIFRTDISITSVDSTAKRIEYVSKTAELLNLDNITAIPERAEVLGNSTEHREKYDIVTARAVAGLQILSELCLPFAKVGGTFIAMKSQKADEEISLASTAIKKCGGIISASKEQLLTDEPAAQESRTIILINKTSSTPKEFPRHYSKISKKPL